LLLAWGGCSKLEHCMTQPQELGIAHHSLCSVDFSSFGPCIHRLSQSPSRQFPHCCLPQVLSAPPLTLSAAQGAKHHVVFFDVKHLFVDTVARVFEHRFDVAFVFRDKDGPGLDAPLDLGMKFVHGGKGNFRGAATLCGPACGTLRTLFMC
jgi:hypothetical protein